MFTKVSKNAKTGPVWGQTVLPERSLLIGQNLARNAKIEKLK